MLIVGRIVARVIGGCRTYGVAFPVARRIRPGIATTDEAKRQKQQKTTHVNLAGQWEVVRRHLGVVVAYVDVLTPPVWRVPTMVDREPRSISDSDVVLGEIPNL